MSIRKPLIFFILFTAFKPIRTIEPVSVLPEKLWAGNQSRIDTINVYIAFLVIRAGLHGAGYMNCYKEPVTLNNPIHVSAHTLIDMIEAYSDATTVDKFQLTSLLIEQICFKVNPLAEYRDRV